MGICIRDISALLPEGEGYTVRTCTVYIEGDRIAGLDRQPENFVAERTLDGSGRLLVPGMVNAHTHAYMTVFRNCADDIGFTPWLFDKIMPMEDRLTEEDCYWGTLLAYMEMLRTGTTCSLDMYIFTQAAVRAQQESGIRAVMSRGLTGGADDVAGGERRLRDAVGEIEQWRGSPNLYFMLGPHAPYTCDEGYLREVAETATALHVPLHIHVSESRDEMRTIAERYGCTPPEFLDRAGILRDTTVAAHCVQLTDSDIDLLSARGVSVATNPVSNLKLGNGVARVSRMLERGINVCLGTDGTASNNTLNMYRELSYLTMLQKGMNEDAASLSAAQGMRMATAGGAKALGLGGQTGEIREGMLADLAILNLDTPWMQPKNNLLASLAYSANGSEVETVLVGGRILLDKGAYTSIDAERVLYEVEQVCRRVGTR